MHVLNKGYWAVEGPTGSGKTSLLVKSTVQLLQTEPSESVLILCSNYYRKSRFLTSIQENLCGAYSQVQVTTYSALVRNTLLLYWPCVESILAEQHGTWGKPAIFPELSGFEASEYLLKKIITQLKTTNTEAFSTFQGSQQSLVRQLIRRLRLRSENCLEREDMRIRSTLMGEQCIKEVEDTIKLFDLWSLKLRVLDNSRQIDIFNHLLKNNQLVQQYFHNRIEHLIIDDLDETIPAQQHFIRFLASSLKTLIMAADLEGGTRRGYLNAYPYDWEGLKKLKQNTQTYSIKRNDNFYTISSQLLKNWIEHEPHQVLPINKEIQWGSSNILRMDMINTVTKDIVDILQQSLKNNPCAPLTLGDLAIVMPRVDVLAYLQISQQLKRKGIPLQVLTGTQRPTDNIICRSLLWLLQLANHSQWKLPLSPLELKGLLRNALKLNELDSAGMENIINEYRILCSRGEFFKLPAGENLSSPALVRYNNLLNWLELCKNEPIEEQFYSGFSKIISPYLTEIDDLTDVQQLIRSFYIKDIASIFYQKNHDHEHLAAKEWLTQVKTGIIADTPSKPKEIDLKAIVLGTPQKIIDFEIRRKIHFWLDISSREWARTDNAPLYNAWVHSVNWDNKTDYLSDEFNQLLARTRAGHITRTLLLHVKEKVFLYSSELDNDNGQNTGIFHKLLLLPDNKDVLKTERAILRDDQAAILTYKAGPMAITAVPGAGKTFVNTELLIEMIERDIPPEKILVLTYMDSAARTIQSRLRNRISKHNITLPVISTIHSLALRIITEDDHAVYLGLDPTNLEIIDEIEKRDLLESILSTIDPNCRYFNSESALSIIGFIKEHKLTLEQIALCCEQKRLTAGRIPQFLMIYKRYQEILTQKGKLDFTDLIIKAIELLESYPEIRKKYQEKFSFIIEDEAQDSSLLLQSLINILQEKHGNLIRTGDTNQSITTTFSTADTSVFRDFTAYCREKGIVVKMDRSSRSAEPIINLANMFIHWACKDEILVNAFESVNIKPVLDKNPIIGEKPVCKVFESYSLEHDWIVDKIKILQKDFPDQSIALLVRGNLDVYNIAKLLQANDIKTISYSNTPEQNSVFLFIAWILKLIEDPSDQNTTKNLYHHMSMLGILSLSPEEKNLYENCNLFALNPDEISNSSLLQLYYNLQDLIRYAFGQDICRMIVRLTDMFFKEPEQRSLGYRCAIQAEEWVEQLMHEDSANDSALEWVNRKLDLCISSKRMPFREIQDDSMISSKFKGEFVRVMTLHKSKGQEFDYVFIPGMTESSFPSDTNKVIWLDSDKIQVEIECLTSEKELDKVELTKAKKLKKVEEEARLVYVGLTRAKKRLFLTCPMKTKNRFGQINNQQESRYFTILKELLNQDSVSLDRTLSNA